MLAAQFAKLADEAPAAIKADMEYYRQLIDQWAAGGDLNIDDPALETHSAAVQSYLLTNCGIDVNQ